MKANKTKPILHHLRPTLCRRPAYLLFAAALSSTRKCNGGPIVNLHAELNSPAITPCDRTTSTQSGKFNAPPASFELTMYFLFEDVDLLMSALTGSTPLCRSKKYVMRRSLYNGIRRIQCFFKRLTVTLCGNSRATAKTVDPSVGSTSAPSA